MYLHWIMRQTHHRKRPPTSLVHVVREGSVAVCGRDSKNGLFVQTSETMPVGMRLCETCAKLQQGAK